MSSSGLRLCSALMPLRPPTPPYECSRPVFQAQDLDSTFKYLELMPWQTRFREGALSVLLRAHSASGVSGAAGLVRWGLRKFKL